MNEALVLYPDVIYCIYLISDPIVFIDRNLPQYLPNVPSDQYSSWFRIMFLFKA